MATKNNQSTNRIYVMVLGGLFFLMCVFYFVNQNATPSSASDAKVNTSFNPSSGTFPYNQIRSTAVLFQTGSSSQKISGLDLVFKSSGVLSFNDITPPIIVIGKNKEIQASLIKKIISSTEAHIVYTYLNATEDLPQAVSVQVSFIGTQTGSGKVTLDTTKSQIVGTIPSHLYIWGKLGSGSYTFIR